MTMSERINQSRLYVCKIQGSDRSPLSVQFFFIFMQFWVKILPNNRLAPLPWGRRPLGEELYSLNVLVEMPGGEKLSVAQRTRESLRGRDESVLLPTINK